MKKYVIPLLLAVAVFLSTISFQPFTILRQEGLGLFLNTPDYYRALFFDPFPLSNLTGSFLVQFYSNVYVGAAIVALMVTAVYFLARGIFRRIGFRLEALNVLCAGTAWFFLARAANPSMGIAIILLSSAVLALLAILGIRRKVKSPLSPVIDIVAGVVCIAAASASVAFNTFIREGEKWSAIEFAAVQGDWNYLLKRATPEEARKDMQVVPYALLALNAKGQLSARLDEYPLMENFGLDYGDEVSYRRSLFDAVLYGCLGCWNEAVHRTHQCGDFLPHCTSFRTLRMLIKENYAMGDSLMVVKYCDILDKSLLHKEFTGYFREHPCRQRVPNTAGESSRAQLIVTKDPMDIMLRLGRCGIESAMAMDRYYSYYKVREYFKDLHQQSAPLGLR